MVVYFFSTNYTVELFIVCIKGALNIKVVNPLLTWVEQSKCVTALCARPSCGGRAFHSQQLEIIQDWKTIHKFFLNQTLPLIYY